jgi:predicted MPP superfamily phosphohydrolase
MRLFVLRPFWYLSLALPLLALASASGTLVGLPFGASAATARAFIAVTAVGLTLLGLAGYLGSRRLVTRHLNVSMPRLPAEFDGVRIAQLSDLHIGPHTSRRFLANVADAVRDASPDLIVMTGDQVDDFAGDVAPLARALGELRAPLGVHAIAGNHDVYAGWPSVARGLRTIGINVLVNESVALDRSGARLWLAGTGDPAASGGRGAARHPAAPDLARTLRDVPSHEPVIVLAHNPALWPGLAERGVDLTLSGHTHYGQLAMPTRNWSLASSFLELAMGVHQRGSALLHINPGTNYWGIPFRLGTPPEVTVLTLRVSDTDSARVADR